MLTVQNRVLSPTTMKHRISGSDRTYDLSAQTLIKEVLIPLGRREIHLHADLYSPLRAYTRKQQTGVLWAVRRLKDEGFLAKTKVRGVYSVVS